MNRILIAVMTAFVFSLGSFVSVQPSSATALNGADSAYSTAGYSKDKKQNNKHSYKKHYKKDHKRDNGKNHKKHNNNTKYGA